MTGPPDATIRLARPADVPRGPGTVFAHVAEADGAVVGFALWFLPT